MIYGTNSRKKEFNGKCIVAFVDILGFSNEINNKWDSSEEELFLRMKKFTKIVNSNISKQIKKVHSEAQRDTYYGCNIMTFSDSIIITYAFNGKPDKRRFLIGMYYTLYTVSFVWKTALDFNFTVRGGIEFGDMRWDNQVIMGPAFIGAHELESKIALSSRVILGDKMSKEVSLALTDSNNTKREMRLKRIHNHLRSLIRPYLFIDYDGKIALTPKTLYMKDIERDILIQKLVSMQNECTDSKARTKYTPLIEAISNKIRGLSDNDLEIIKNSYATSTT